MHSRRTRRLPTPVLFAVAVLAACCLSLVGSANGQAAADAKASPTTASASKKSARPRLAVVVVIDQMRADYLQRWQKLFGEGGFRRLTTEGAWFQNCNYPYAVTITGPGHASISTGTSAYKHGIVMNDWYERETGKTVYCVESRPQERIFPSPPDGPSAEKHPAGSAPTRLLSPTLADPLKDQNGEKSHVVSLSYKDRSAVLLGGKHPDACYWFDTAAGQVVTSTYYPAFAQWVAQFNRQSRADRWFGKDWVRLRDDIDYAKYSGPDDVAGESTGYSEGRTFPHPMTGGDDKPGKNYYEAVYTSPFGNELLLEFVLQAIDAEQLGKHDAPDLLCVSFSSTDAAGHAWGPDSQEVLDTTLRMDGVMRRLLDGLDEKVGKGQYILALSADHGVCPLPEVSLAADRAAGRISPKTLDSGIEQMLKSKFDKDNKGGAWIEKSAYPWLYLNQKQIEKFGLKSAEVEEAVVEWLKKQPGIQTAYGRAQLLQGKPHGDPIGERVWMSFYPDRCGDVVVVSKPYYLIFGSPVGTTHGTPHPYDTHVPLLVYGKGVLPAIRTDPVTPQALAAIVAKSLGIKPPRDEDAEVPKDIFAVPNSASAKHFVKKSFPVFECGPKSRLKTYHLAGLRLHMRAQIETCAKYGASYVPSASHLKVGIARSVKDGPLPINGLRLQPEEGTTGWFIWAGEQMSQDADFFVPVHVSHLEEWSPAVVKFIGLPPGWRFLVAGDYEDAWEDKSLLEK